MKYCMALVDKGIRYSIALALASRMSIETSASFSDIYKILW